MNKRQRKKRNRKHAGIPFNFTFPDFPEGYLDRLLLNIGSPGTIEFTGIYNPDLFWTLEAKITEAWKKFWDELPPEIREGLDEQALLQDVLGDAAKKLADQELERQCRGTGMVSPAGIMNYKFEGAPQPHGILTFEDGRQS